MKSINLKNFTIKKLADKNSHPYFLIVNNENQEEAYFCFEKSVKDGWNNLLDNYQNIQEIELEFEEKARGNKVISLYTFSEIDILV